MDAFKNIVAPACAQQRLHSKKAHFLFLSPCPKCAILDGICLPERSMLNSGFCHCNSSINI